MFNTSIQIPIMNVKSEKWLLLFRFVFIFLSVPNEESMPTKFSESLQDDLELYLLVLRYW
jgi:hypothetical protein